MNKKQVMAITFVSVLLFSALAGLQLVYLVAANPLPPPAPTVQVYIRNDGSVYPATTPIQRFGNVYVFTDNLLNHTIEVQCDNIVIDGAGFILQGVGTHWYAGITLSNRSNVKIKNIDIRSYVKSVLLQQSSNNIITNNRMLTAWNIILDSSSNNQITGNNITGQHTGYGYGVQVNSGSFYNAIIGNTFTDTGIGVRVRGGDYTTISENHFKRGTESVQVSASHNIISKNNMEDGRYGIMITGSGSYNTVFENFIAGKSKRGISIYMGVNNTIYENHIANNVLGVQLGIVFEIPGREVGYNTFYRNNFVNNTQNVLIGNPPSRNFWDNGKEGNYWGGYSGTPYVIDENNRDNHPLMGPVAMHAWPISTWSHDSEGNYWSNYKGTDNDGDGIGDTPYFIDENNQENYPLVNPWFPPPTPEPQESEPFPTWIVATIVIAAIAVVGAALLIYFRMVRKIRRKSE